MLASRGWRVGTRVALSVAGLLTFLCLALFLAAVRNDHAITAHTGRGTAEVLAVRFDRTVVSFKTPDGVTHRPPNGVLYPDGLRAGQLVSVEYDTTNPDLVRVAGRTAMHTLVPLLVVLASTWIVAGGVLWWAARVAPREGFLPHGSRRAAAHVV